MMSFMYTSSRRIQKVTIAMMVIIIIGLMLLSSSHVGDGNGGNVKISFSDVIYEWAAGSIL